MSLKSGYKRQKHIGACNCMWSQFLVVSVNESSSSFPAIPSSGDISNTFCALQWKFQVAYLWVPKVREKRVKPWFNNSQQWKKWHTWDKLKFFFYGVYPNSSSFTKSMFSYFSYFEQENSMCIYLNHQKHLFVLNAAI